jgi:sugar-specific transcriptional regulator TrmB
MKIDPELVRKCYECWVTSLQLMKEIEKQVIEFCNKNNLEPFLIRKNVFEPFNEYERKHFIKFLAFTKGKHEGPVYIIINDKGDIKVKAPIEMDEEEI